MSPRIAVGAGLRGAASTLDARLDGFGAAFGLLVAAFSPCLAYVSAGRSCIRMLALGVVAGRRVVHVGLGASLEEPGLAPARRCASVSCGGPASGSLFMAAMSPAVEGVGTAAACAFVCCVGMAVRAHRRGQVCPGLVGL